jgi:hypothetical protein
MNFAKVVFASLRTSYVKAGQGSSPMIHKRSLTAYSVGTLGIAAALLAIAPLPALAFNPSNPFYTPAGSQLDNLDTDPILDIVPDGLIAFSLSLNTDDLNKLVRRIIDSNGNFVTAFRYNAITGIGLLANFDPGELGNPQFTNSGLFASALTNTTAGAFSIRLASGTVALNTGTIDLGSIAFSTNNLNNDTRTDFSLTAVDITQVDLSQLGDPDNEHTFSAIQAGMGPSQIIEVQPVPAPLSISCAAAAIGYSRKLNKLRKSMGPY